MIMRSLTFARDDPEDTTMTTEIDPTTVTGALPARDVAALLDLARGGTPAEIRDRCFVQLASWFAPCATGLYLFDASSCPVVCMTEGVTAGFLEEYEAEVRADDPVLRHVLRSHRATGSESLTSIDWAGSPAFSHLQRWGFESNLQGPLEADGQIFGTLNLARSMHGATFVGGDVERFAWACRAVSIALSGPQAEAGEFADADTSRAIPFDPCDQLPLRAGAVARLIREGASNKAIARRLGISEQTVKEHVRALCARFLVANRTALCATLLCCQPHLSVGLRQEFRQPRLMSRGRPVARDQDTGADPHDRSHDNRD
jgi:DNA-binding CsgD family transcriptional regulator